MTDLSTTHLQHLLAEATAGPWRAEVGAAGVPDGWDEHWRTLHMGDDSVLEVVYEPPTEEEYANFKLAALAPELTQEVIRLREQVKGLILAMETKAANNEWQDPATIARYLKEIVLGAYVA